MEDDGAKVLGGEFCCYWCSIRIEVTDFVGPWDREEASFFHDIVADEHGRCGKDGEPIAVGSRIGTVDMTALGGGGAAAAGHGDEKKRQKNEHMMPPMTASTERRKIPIWLARGAAAAHFY